MSNRVTWPYWCPVPALAATATFFPEVIDEDDTVVVPIDTQYIVHGDLVVEGELDLTADGSELVIL